MPFDAAEYQVETKPAITRLIEALRGPEPHWWNFGECGTCALHTAVVLKLIREEDFDMIEEALQISGEASGALFGAVDINGELYGVGPEEVRPGHVATALEHFLATEEALSPMYFVQKERG